MKVKFDVEVVKRLLIVVLFFAGFLASAQRLSPSAEISILTLGPGEDELYAAFGHSAIRVRDRDSGFDAAYNYGTFDFNRPNFYLNFAKGYLVYKLAVQDAQGLLAYYKHHNRSITEQVLNLTLAQKQKVFDYLQNNAKPENADYFYDYFYDNCATKIGDVFIEALGSEFRFDERFVDIPGRTIRELTDDYSAEYFPWGKLGIDLCLGMPMDVQLSNMQYTYLPDYVLRAFSLAEINQNGAWLMVVVTTKKLFVANEQNRKKPILTPKLSFWLFFIVILAISTIAFRKGIHLKGIDFFLFFIIGLLGIFFALLWLATDHAAAAWNLNLLWAWPTHLVIAFWLFKKTKPRWVNWYLLITSFLAVVLVVFWPFVPQDLNNALIPIVLTVGLRSIVVVVE